MNVRRFLAVTITSLSLMPSAFTAEPPTVATTPLPGPEAKGTDPEIIGEEMAVLSSAPNVPPPIKRKHATKVTVELEVREVVKRMSAIE